MNNIKLTPWVSANKGKQEYITAKLEGEAVAAVFTAGKYGCAVFERELSGIKPCFNYKISADIKKEKQTVKLIVGFKDGGGTELTKMYAENGGCVLSPENAESAIVTVSVWGDEGGAFSLSDLKFEEIGEYKPQKIVASTIGLKYNKTIRTPEWNMEQTLSEIDRLCSTNKPDIIVLTEHMYDRWTNSLEPLSLDSEVIKTLCGKARQYSTYMVFSLRIKRGDRLTNTGFLINRSGEIEGLYDKSHITMNERFKGCVPGDDFKVFDTELGRIAIVICWDMFFPEFISALRKQKVDIICHPSAGFLKRRVAERAYESGAYIITSGVEELTHSAIFNPLGDVIADASENDGYAVCEIDINKPYYTYWLSYPAYTMSDNIFENERRGELYDNEESD